MELSNPSLEIRELDVYNVSSQCMEKKSQTPGRCYQPPSILEILLLMSWILLDGMLEHKLS